MPVSYMPTKAVTKQKKQNTQIDPCPTCGELQCLCRPRFFAGQLLTEEDLNRLDRYIVEKNKLHNRHLHGWGVVGGLEVLCHPCKDRVAVTSGFAISPCGEDIVICKDEEVHICDLIKECKNKERKDWECQPPYNTKNQKNGCEENQETWALAVRYDEKPSRGITALPSSNTPGCCSRCNCEGSSNCGCSCHERNNGKSNKVASNMTKRILAQCEPTIMCESYDYEVFRVPVDDPNKVEVGDMFEGIMECFQQLIEVIPNDLANYKDMQPDDLLDLCCRIKLSLETFLIKNPSANCQILEDLAAIVCPPPGQLGREQYRLIFEETLTRIAVVTGDYLLHCLCSGMLPPNPETEEDPRVVLATVTIRKSDCKIVKVCNWTTLRKFATTLPNLQYWLSWSPLVRMLRDRLEEICCKVFEQRGKAAAAQVNASEFAKFRAKPQYATNSKAFSDLLFDSFLQKSSPINAEVLLKGMKGVKDEKGESYLKEVEKENLAPFLLLSQVAQPVLKVMTPDNLKGLITLIQSVIGKKPRKPAKKGVDEITELRFQMDKLRETVEGQQKKINRLTKK